MSWFFTKAALLTFGGAYAVLPYIYQGAVVNYQWLTPPQMIDGLALGETTPGPLIMVVAFVGYVGGYVNAAFGPDHLFLGGALAAIMVTWFTFLPSFLFIFAGGPFIETTHNDITFTAPLTAIPATGSNNELTGLTLSPLSQGDILRIKVRGSGLLRSSVSINVRRLLLPLPHGPSIPMTALPLRPNLSIASRRW